MQIMLSSYLARIGLPWSRWILYCSQLFRQPYLSAQDAAYKTCHSIEQIVRRECPAFLSYGTQTQRSSERNPDIFQRGLREFHTDWYRPDALSILNVFLSPCQWGLFPFITVERANSPCLAATRNFQLRPREICLHQHDLD